MFYYVLTSGKHPFGESLRRQAAILSGEYNLQYLPGDGELGGDNLIMLLTVDYKKILNNVTIAFQKQGIFRIYPFLLLYCSIIQIKYYIHH